MPATWGARLRRAALRAREGKPTTGSSTSVLEAVGSSRSLKALVADNSLRSIESEDHSPVSRRSSGRSLLSKRIASTRNLGRLPQNGASFRTRPTPSREPSARSKELLGRAFASQPSKPILATSTTERVLGASTALAQTKGRFRRVVTALKGAKTIRMLAGHQTALHSDPSHQDPRGGPKELRQFRFLPKTKKELMDVRARLDKKSGSITRSRKLSELQMDDLAETLEGKSMPSVSASAARKIHTRKLTTLKKNLTVETMNDSSLEDRAEFAMKMAEGAKLIQRHFRMHLQRRKSAQLKAHLSRFDSKNFEDYGTAAAARSDSSSEGNEDLEEDNGGEDEAGGEEGGPDRAARSVRRRRKKKSTRYEDPLQRTERKHAEADPSSSGARTAAPPMDASARKRSILKKVASQEQGSSSNLSASQSFSNGTQRPDSPEQQDLKRRVKSVRITTNSPTWGGEGDGGEESPGSDRDAAELQDSAAGSGSEDEPHRETDGELRSRTGSFGAKRPAALKIPAGAEDDRASYQQISKTPSARSLSSSTPTSAKAGSGKKMPWGSNQGTQSKILNGFASPWAANTPGASGGKKAKGSERRPWGSATANETLKVPSEKRAWGAPAPGGRGSAMISAGEAAGQSTPMKTALRSPMKKAPAAPPSPHNAASPSAPVVRALLLDSPSPTQPHVPPEAPGSEGSCRRVSDSDAPSAAELPEGASLPAPGGVHEHGDAVAESGAEAQQLDTTHPVPVSTLPSGQGIPPPDPDSTAMRQASTTEATAEEGHHAADTARGTASGPPLPPPGKECYAERRGEPAAPQAGSNAARAQREGEAAAAGATGPQGSGRASTFTTNGATAPALALERLPAASRRDCGTDSSRAGGSRSTGATPRSCCTVTTGRSSQDVVVEADSGVELTAQFEFHSIQHEFGRLGAAQIPLQEFDRSHLAPLSELVASTIAMKEAGPPCKGKPWPRRSSGGRITSGRLSGRVAPMAVCVVSGAQYRPPEAEAAGAAAVQGPCGATNRPPRRRQAEHPVQTTAGPRHPDLISVFPAMEPWPKTGGPRSGRRASKGGYSARRACRISCEAAAAAVAAMPQAGLPREPAVLLGVHGPAVSRADGPRFGRRARHSSARKREFVTKLDEEAPGGQAPWISASDIPEPAPLGDQIDELLQTTLQNRDALAIRPSAS